MNILNYQTKTRRDTGASFFRTLKHTDKVTYHNNNNNNNKHNKKINEFKEIAVVLSQCCVVLCCVIAATKAVTQAGCIASAATVTAPVPAVNSQQVNNLCTHFKNFKMSVVFVGLEFWVGFSLFSRSFHFPFSPSFFLIFNIFCCSCCCFSVSFTFVNNCCVVYIHCCLWPLVVLYSVVFILFYFLCL